MYIMPQPQQFDDFCQILHTFPAPFSLRLQVHNYYFSATRKILDTSVIFNKT